MKAAIRQLLFGASAWTPAGLFRSGAQGAWYDPSNLGSMYQDSAGTTPVTAVGQPVGKMLDLSGRGNHRTQSTSTSRPTLQQDSGGRYYLSYDGVDDGMATASIDFTGTAQMTVFAGVYKASDAAPAVLWELGANTGTASQTFGVVAPSAVGSANYSARSNGSLLTNANGAGTYPAPHTAVLTHSTDIAADGNVLRVNGVQYVSGSSDQGNGNYSNAALNMGKRANGSLFLNGRDYGLIVLGRAATATEIARTEKWLAARMGVQL